MSRVVVLQNSEVDTGDTDLYDSSPSLDCVQGGMMLDLEAGRVVPQDRDGGLDTGSEHDDDDGVGEIRKIQFLQLLVFLTRTHTATTACPR